MSKSSTYNAIKVCCSLITPFNSFTTVFMMIQESASNRPHENSTHMKLALTHITPLRSMDTPLSPGAIGVPYVS